MKLFKKPYLLRFACVFLFLLCFTSGSKAQEYLANVKHYGVEDGLSNRDVYAIHQDKKGFIWVGTQYGLNRFDGNTFKVYTKEKNGLASNAVHHILEDDAEKLWLFELNNWWYPVNPKQISIFDQETNSIQSFEKYFENEAIPFRVQDVHYCFTADDGKLIITTIDEKIFIYQSKLGIRKLKWEEKGARPLTFSPDNTIWGVIFNASQNGYEQFIEVDTQGQVLQRCLLPEIYGNVDLLYFEEGHKIWFSHPLETSKLGLSYLDIKLNKIFPYHDEHEILKEVFPVDWTGQTAYWKKNNCFWYKHGTELLVFDTEKGKLYDFGNRHPELLNANIQRFFFDRKGSTWIGTASGLYRVEMKLNPFAHFFNQHYDSYEISKAYSCRGIVATEDEIYVNTYKGRQSIRFSDGHQTPIPASYFLDERGDSVLVGVLALALLQDDESQLWFGDVSLIQRDIEKNTEEVFITDAGHEAILAWSIYEDEQKKIWVGTHNGLAYLDRNVSRIRRTEVSPGYETLSQSVIYSFVKSQKGHVWLSTTTGLFSWTPEAGILQRYWAGANSGFNIPHDDIQHVHEDSDGVLWLATLGGGLLRVVLDGNLQVDTVNQFTVIDGLSNNNLYAVYEDLEEQLWVSSDYGIIQFDKNSYKAKAYLPKDGVTHQEFNRISHYQAKDGTLYFGGLNGITAFNPNELNQTGEKKYDAPLEITAYQQFIAKSDKIVDYTSELLNGGRISLSPGDRFQYLSFALLDFIDARQNHYRYKLEGVNGHWEHIQENYIRLGTLPYGEFNLIIQGQGADGRFSTQVLNIPIEVLRPFYLQSWFGLMAISTIALLILAFYKWRTRALIKRQLILENEVKDRTQTIVKQAEELRQLDQLKSRFFANVSHELRTPLTLILGPLSTVLKSTNLFPDHKQLLKTARQNGQSLLELVNEILNLTKLESGKLKLFETPTMLFPLLSRITASFESFAEYQNIQLQLHYQANQDLQMLLDVDKFQKIINNLLSNGFKFTPENGKIEVIVNDKNNLIQLEVKDTGRGIHPDDLPFVFNRFYQSKRPNVATEGGTGIGLALCMEYAKLFGGTLEVESTIGEGSNFILKFPKKEVEIGALQEMASDAQKEKTKYNTVPVLSTIDQKNQNKKKATILLVEDNHDLQNYIQYVLSKAYNVITADNGAEALGKLGIGDEELGMSVNISNSEWLIPDLIVSDIMMPVMDGFQLLETLKSNDQWRHIPVVMLTARAEISDKLKALRIGVDDYLTKPFEEEELLARVSNLLHNHKARTAWLKNESTEKDDASKPESDLPLISKEEQEWLKTLEVIVQDNQKDSTFNVERLTELLFISRRQLQRRIKQLTGLSPNQYIQEARLQRAKDLLENQSKPTVKAIAFEVGIRDVKYFSQQFKKRFGKLPSSYF